MGLRGPDVENIGTELCMDGLEPGAVFCGIRKLGVHGCLVSVMHTNNK